ncbi:hypothetical protein AMEX_G10961, partial [Astyanax mexicanus]
VLYSTDTVIMFTKILHILFSVKTDITGLQVQTVKTGNNVTMKCDQNNENNKDNIDLNVAWYKQSLGNVPKLIVRLMVSKKNMRFSTDFAAGPFKFDGDTFDLSINETKEEDAAVYYCGKISKSGVVEFESGTRLIKTDGYPPTKMVIKSGDSATIQCSVQPLSCSEDHSVYWFRHGSGESDPGIIFTHGNRSDQCKKSSETVSPTQSCIYKLPKNNLSLSDAGTYYCAVAACGHIFFGNGTEVNVTGEFWLHLIYLFDAVNYAALNFAKRPPPSRTPRRVQESQDIYSRVKHS